jgi:hypothetical protein
LQVIDVFGAGGWVERVDFAGKVEDVEIAGIEEFRVEHFLSLR